METLTRPSPTIVPLCYAGERQHGNPIPFAPGSLPVFRCDAATELMFAVMPREMWHPEEWYLQPPAAACWLETGAPSAINSEGTVTPWDDTRAQAWCALMSYLTRREAEDVAQRSEVIRDLPQRPQWRHVVGMMTMRIYVQWVKEDPGRRRQICPTVNEYFFLDASGKIVGDEHDNFVLSMVDPWLQENLSLDSEEKALEIVDSVRALRNALLFAIHLLNHGAATGTGKTRLLSALPRVGHLSNEPLQGDRP